MDKPSVEHHDDLNTVDLDEKKLDVLDGQVLPPDPDAGLSPEEKEKIVSLRT